ncbi:putative lipoprotein [Pseudomonas chlororaphis subsp. aureofaciens]|nr:putative lipoprotein [Pseudomonas chlororaphis subsp. aureofaciens]
MRRLLLTLVLLGSGLAHAGELPETDWLELMPKSDQKALEQMPEIDHNSPEANGTFTEKGGLKQSKGLPAVMYSTKTVPAMNGKDIRIGGYPVPLESDAKGRSTLFSSCLIRAPASMCRHRRPTSWCWCVSPRA